MRNRPRGGAGRSTLPPANSWVAESFFSERIPDRQLQGAIWIERARVEVVAVFQSDGADDGLIANTQPDGIKLFRKRIISQVHGRPKRIAENHHRPFAAERLLQLEIELRVG